MKQIALAEEGAWTPPPDRAVGLRTYRLFSTTGNRTEFQGLATPWRGRVTPLVFAECLEDSGRFLHPLEATARELCDWPTWVLSDHDLHLDNLEGRRIDIDLGATHVGGDLAATLVLLGGRLDPGVARLVRSELRHRLLAPFRDMTEGRQPPMGWMGDTNNWVAASGIADCVLGCQPTRPWTWYIARRLGVPEPASRHPEHLCVAGGMPILCDPGKEQYTRLSFSERRYESVTRNSHGHPVPLVAGQLQRAGRDAAARVVRTEFRPTRDEFVLDLAAAYAVPKPETVERRAIFHRDDRRIDIEDRVRFREPRDFGIALATYGAIERKGDTLSIDDGAASVRVHVRAEGTELRYSVEELVAAWQASAKGIRVESASPASAR